MQPGCDGPVHSPSSDHLHWSIFPDGTSCALADGLGYHLSNRPFATEPTLPIWDRLNAATLIRFVREYNPDIAICTHFMPAGILGQLIASGQLSTSLSIVTTDYDFHGIWLDRTFSRYFVALDETKAHVQPRICPWR